MFFALYYQGKMQDAFREATYLAKTWPKNEQYQRLRDTTSAVARRPGAKGTQSEAEGAPPGMAGCN